MRKPIWTRTLAALILALMLISTVGCSNESPPSGPAPSSLSTAAKPEFSRTPPVANWTSLKKQWTTPPTAPSDPTNPFGVDLRLADMGGVDLTQSRDVLLNYATFDTDTKWPAKMPSGYDPARILELGKSAGLGVAALHREGITGKGVHVAFLDQTLLLDHTEYQGRIRKYGEIGQVAPQAEMHGAAVTSILAGKSVGVAPDVQITYYATQVAAGQNKRTFIYLAQGINRILDDNAKLPEAEKIRIIGMSIGWGPEEEGYKEIEAAVARAKKEGVFVLSTSVEKDYTFKFNGLGRDPLSDPEDYRSYRPGIFWKKQYLANPQMNEGRIQVPMDARTTAAPTGTSAYAFYRTGGWSWCIPYLEGVYAMGLQVKPDLTPEQFYKAAVETGWYTEFAEGGKTYRLGPIINPEAVVKQLRGK